MNVLIIDDDEILRRLLARELERSGHGVDHAGTAAEGLAKASTGEPDVVLLDLMLPDLSGIDVLQRLRAERPATEVVVLTAHGTVDTAIRAIKLGAYDYVQKPYRLEELELTVERAYQRRRLSLENARLREVVIPGLLGPDFVGCGQAFEDMQRLIAKVAASDSTVLVRGETGTGKEMVARSLHRLSPRRDEPFVVVDCAALHDNLLQSELFGHEKGAFTGATQLRHGLFEAANGGTLFLDEVGDVSPAVQAGLLRVLESSSFRRLGGNNEVKVDVRLVAATNRDLERLMRENHFRQDLYFRLKTIHIDVPPLRERTGDIHCLTETFVDRHNARCGTHKQLTPRALDALCRYDWPGNVRELRHAIERAMVLADTDSVDVTDLPAEIHRVSRPSAMAEDPGLMALCEVEKRHVEHVLAQVGGHRARAAEALGISERSLYRKIHEYHLESTDGASRH